MGRISSRSSSYRSSFCDVTDRSSAVLLPNQYMSTSVVLFGEMRSDRRHILSSFSHPEPVRFVVV